MTSTNTYNLIQILALAASTSLPTSLTFNVTCAVTPMDYQLDGYNRRIKWHVFTDNVSYHHEHLMASEHLLCIQGMSFPNSPLHCRTYPHPSDVYLPAIAATTSLYLPCPSSPINHPDIFSSLQQLIFHHYFRAVCGEFPSNYLGVS